MPSVSPARISLPARYRVVRHLANGGMASVWEAHDELLGRDVAVKLLASHLGEDERARRRFQREARAAAGLSSHPHVVTIYDVGEHANRVFMVMELMRGGTLGDRLKAAREIPPSTALRWLREAAGALDAAHDAGVVHRDIKPANLLLDDHERLAIADFGIARLAWEDQLTATGQVLGTAAYIAPEQAMGEPATAASDRYSFAVVAYELLTGARPFEGGHFAAQARAHVEDPPPPPSSRNPSLSAAVDAVMERALAKAPEDRWASAEQFVAALERTVAGESRPATAPTRRVTTRRAAAPERPRRRAGGALLAGRAAAPERPRRRAGGALLAGLAALLVLGVGGAVALLGGGGGDGGSGRAQATDTPTATRTATAPPKKTATQAPAKTPTPSPSATASPTATSTATGGGGIAEARRLQLAGFNARKAGDYAGALRNARAALAACGDAHQLDPCGYALFEEGAALNRSGDPAAAIPVLQQRLSAYGDNAGGEVGKELRDAQAKVSGAKPGKKTKRKKGRGG